MAMPWFRQLVFFILKIMMDCNAGSVWGRQSQRQVLSLDLGKWGKVRIRFTVMQIIFCNIRNVHSVPIHSSNNKHILELQYFMSRRSAVIFKFVFILPHPLASLIYSFRSVSYVGCITSCKARSPQCAIWCFLFQFTVSCRFFKVIQ